jgi:hypothetical protein
MPQARQAPLHSTEDLRTVYRALGLSEQTLERAIQYSQARLDGPTTPELPEIKKRRGRPRQNLKRIDQAEPAGQPKRLPAASVKLTAARQRQA